MRERESATLVYTHNYVYINSSTNHGVDAFTEALLDATLRSSDFELYCNLSNLSNEATNGRVQDPRHRGVE